jgi:hypothetical protein
MGGMAPPVASARDPFTAFRASCITTIAVVSSSASRWWVRRASSALTSFSFAGSRSAAVRLVCIASVRVPRRRWGVVHIAADPPVDPPEPDAAWLRGPALALRRRFGRGDAGSRGEVHDCAEDHDQRADRLAVHPAIISRCSQLVQIYPIKHEDAPKCLCLRLAYAAMIAATQPRGGLLIGAVGDEVPPDWSGATSPAASRVRFLPRRRRGMPSIPATVISRAARLRFRPLRKKACALCLDIAAYPAVTRATRRAVER